MTLGLGAVALLTVVGGGVALLRPGLIGGRLTPHGREVFQAVARAVLAGLLPADEPALQAALEAHLQRLDNAIVTLPRATRSELSQLLALLSSTPGRLGIAGLRTDWPQASSDEIQASLQNMRTAPIDLRQQAYHALRRLTAAAYFADSGTWRHLGYPGPPDL